jgi:hypothetical protein
MSCATAVCVTASLQAASDVVEPEPLHCWWRTSVSAVRIGESFSAVLTCATVETSALSVVVDRSALEPVAAALPPFEVLGGKRSPDLLTGDRRFFQYEYNLRLISDELFDRDVPLPDLPITYKVRSTVAGQAAAVEGPDQRYALPPIAVRILSLVPDTERDIRDTTMGTFSSLDEARSRADVLVTAGLVISALGAGLAVLGMTTMLIARRRGPRAGRGGMLSDVTVVRAVRRELASIRRERASSGWTPALIGRALAALRVLAAYALGRPVTQRRVDQPAATYDGAVALLGWGERRPRIVASGAVTTESVASALRPADEPTVGSLRDPTSQRWFGGPPRRTAPAERRAGPLEPIHAALQAFTESRYGSGDIATDARLDEGLAVADRLGTRLAIERSRLGSIARQAAHLRPRSWSR